MQTATRSLVDALKGAPGSPLRAVEVLTEAARRQVLIDWNDTTTDGPAVSGAHELFAASVAAVPDAVAVACGDEWVSYRELAERSNRLAHYLRTSGVGPGSVIGLCLERGVEMITALVAVWKAGAAYLPVDPGFPAERIAFMLTDSHAALLVSTEDILAELPAGRIHAVSLDNPVVAAAVAGCPVSPPPSVAAMGELAYVMYTSGSTGTPKGVAVTHRGLVNYLAWAASAYGMGAGPSRRCIRR